MNEDMGKPTNTTEADEMKRLRARYEELTGRTSRAKTLASLRVIVRDVEERAAKGVDTMRTGGDATMNISLSSEAMRLVPKLMRLTKSKNRSALMRRALANLAITLGLSSEAETLAQ